MPQPTNYLCTKCDFSGSDFSTWGSYSYFADNQLIPINRRVAICYGCDAVVSAEVLPDEESTRSVDGEDLGKQLFPEDESRRAKALKNRKSPARCLACGSHDFEYIPNVEPENGPGQTTSIRTGLIHRNCGGRIYADFSAPHFFMGSKLPERIYDIEGLEMKSDNEK